MLNRDSFAEQLLKTVVPQNLSIEEKVKIYNELQSESNKILPEKLYRYRNCNDNSISAFVNDEVWVVKTNLMNDGFDTRPYIDMAEAEEKIIQQWDPIIKSGFTEQMLSTEGLSPLFEVIRQQMKDIPIETLNEQLKQIHDFLVNEMTIATSYIPTITQNSIKIGCFSEEIYSPYMWGQYANNESGFALEYSFREIPCVESIYQGQARNGFILPVVYSDKRYKIPVEYVLYLLMYRVGYQALNNTGLLSNYPYMSQSLLLSIICPDETVATKIGLHKSRLWEQESEWRLFVSSDDINFQNSNAACCIKKPTAIYLGRRISSLNEKILRMLAAEKNLPVYKMHLDDASPSYDLKVGN